MLMFQGKVMNKLIFVKRNILSLYEEDLAKYDTENREKDVSYLSNNTRAARE